MPEYIKRNFVQILYRLSNQLIYGYISFQKMHQIRVQLSSHYWAIDRFE